MKNQTKHRVINLLMWACFAACALVLAATLTVSNSPVDTEYAARKVERITAKRMQILDSFIEEALCQDHSGWMQLQRIPDDMVVYRYVSDSLQSWSNQFPVSNDDIGHRIVFQRLTNPRRELESPLSAITDETAFINLGSKWYLAKSREDDDCKVIAGLEIANELDSRAPNGINPHLRLGDNYSVVPLSNTGGSPVKVNDIPAFKVVLDTLKDNSGSDADLIWLSFLLYLAGSLLLLYNNRTPRTFALVTALFIVVSAVMYFWGRGLHASSTIFAPTLYADGSILYSLGAVFLVNLTICVLVVCTYMMRGWMIRMAQNGKRWMTYALSALAAVFIVAILAYAIYAFRSIIYNSSISLELYKLGELSEYTALVYLSFIALLMSVPLLLQMLRPAVKFLLGLHYNPFSPLWRGAYAVLVSAILVTIAAVSGFEKEKNRLQVWAGQLSMDREMGLEMQLKAAEPQISSDVVVSALAALDDAADMIYNRISESYFQRIVNDYDIAVYLLNSSESARQVLSAFGEKLQSGVPIYDNSRFLYTTDSNGRVEYLGMFSYVAGDALNHILISVAPKYGRNKQGYSALLSLTPPGKVLIPARYSYARYNAGRLLYSQGNYAYSTRIDERMAGISSKEGPSNVIEDGYVHFVNSLFDEETVVISRPEVEFSSYFFAAAFLSLLLFLSLTAMMAVSSKRRSLAIRRGYYRSRVTSVVVFSLVATLVVMAFVSVIFVYRRNDANMRSIMSERINSVRAILEQRTHLVKDCHELNTQEFGAVLSAVSDMTNSDLTVYQADGRVFLSTNPQIFERQFVSGRINQDAYDQVIYRSKRYAINRETLAGRKFYSLYAPLQGRDGSILAIVNTPYVDESYDFEREAVLHAVTILTLFLILLILARFMTMTIVDRIFQPLGEMRRKMTGSSIDSLQKIEYDNEDEITSLVISYNRMVDELAESSVQLAQAERNKAWSAMARQVAHEIKNPLTPMKLQLQRLIRLKQKNDPQWDEKFSEGSKVILDHIDILTETANEFSSFAKLYTEEPSEINLDALLQEEIAMFDNKDNISFDYIGLKDAKVSGPKPQLTRVFVNLISNSVQALDERGEGGRILISLRKSMREGFYDIVFEDDGPGVPKENVPKLFTPNFTTKSGGSGLGLAISRSVLENCNATISYSKSFSLGGACFTIMYPKI